MPAHPAVFFDRDGVVNASPGDGYVLRWEDFHFNAGIMQATKLCQQRGCLRVLVTSQQGVGKGLMSQATLNEIHQRMQAELAVQGAPFDHIATCTHLAGTCTCRKPSPEMVLEAARFLGIDLNRSLLIGDHDRDIEMAVRAGVRTTVRVRSHHAIGIDATHTLDSTSDLVKLLETLL